MAKDRRYLDGDDIGQLIRESLAAKIVPSLPPGYRLVIDVVFHGTHGKKAAGETASLRDALVRRALANATKRSTDRQPESQDDVEPPLNTRLETLAAIVDYRIEPIPENPNA